MPTIFTRIIALFMAVINAFSLLFSATRGNNFSEDVRPFWGGGRMSVSDVAYENNAVYFTADGVKCLLQFTSPHGWRLRTAQEDGSFDDWGAGQTLARDLGEAVPDTVEPISYNGNDRILSAPDGSTAQLKNGSGIVFRTPSGKQAYNIDVIFTDSDGILHVAGDLDANERLYGTGERFDSVDQRGKRMSIYSYDGYMELDDTTYLAIPIVVSSRGCGMFMNRFENQVFDLGHYAKNRFDMELYDAACDLYVFATEKISDVLYGYQTISGYAAEPSDWSYGVQVCRSGSEFASFNGVNAMIEKMAANDIPWDAVIIEGFPAYNKGQWEELARITDYVHSLGKKVMMYQVPGEISGWIDSTFGGVRDEYLVHLDGGTSIPWAYRYGNVHETRGSRFLDLTSADARNWWFGEVWQQLADIGIDGSKIDFCEIIPDFKNLQFSDGRAAAGTHHWYPTYYNTLMYDFMDSVLPDGTMNLSRGGGIGAQRSSMYWSGDQSRDFQWLNAQLKGLLSTGLSGVPFISHDMSGYKPTDVEFNPDPEEEVFLRGLSYTCFSTNMESHGRVTRPYDYSARTTKLYSIYANMHEALRPYLKEYGKISTETGLPLMRALVLFDQNDGNCADIWNEYVLGDAFLVAPILEKGKISRIVYLPKGEWTDLWSGETYNGGRTVACRASTAKVPVFVNKNSASATLDGVLSAIRPYIDQINAMG